MIPNMDVGLHLYFFHNFVSIVISRLEKMQVLKGNILIPCILMTNIRIANEPVLDIEIDFNLC